jgi:hypothetical protein
MAAPNWVGFCRTGVANVVSTTTGRPAAKIPGVLTAFHVAGEDDYLLHVAVRTPQELRDLVLNHVVVHGGVQHTQTQLVFSVLHGPGAPIDARTRPTRTAEAWPGIPHPGNPACSPRTGAPDDRRRCAGRCCSHEGQRR